MHIRIYMIYMYLYIVCHIFMHMHTRAPQPVAAGGKFTASLVLAATVIRGWEGIWVYLPC